MDARRPQVVVITEAGVDVARRAAEAVDGVVVEAKAGDATAAETLRGLFAAGETIIGVCAVGILVRALAPLIGSKQSDPPVIAVSADGASIVPVLGGHHGANALARRLAEALDGHAAVTTASEAIHGVALDEPPRGWRLTTPADAKAAMAAIAAGGEVDIAGDAPWVDDWRAALKAGPMHLRMEQPGLVRERVLLTVQPKGSSGPAEWLNLGYAAQNYVVGVGCARGCAAEELEALVYAALVDADVPPAAVAGVFSIDVKADEAAVEALADRLDVSARYFAADALEAMADRVPNPSAVVYAEVGTHSVAEAAALLGAGSDAELVAEKRKSANATVAIARAPEPIVDLPGRPRGRLAVVGIGPGQSGWRTPEASKLIAEAEELVGYGLYLDILGPAVADKPRKDFPLGAEEDRCRYALEEAGKGRSIALISSGDAGIYAMGALVMELAARGDAPNGVSPEARRADVVMAPGITALQAASARAGAMIGHDFCAVSLSDLLTPRDVILKRLEAAAAGDFVVAFYNPVSRRRRTLLAEAREILLAHRTPETPVLLATDLGRPSEALKRRTLATLEVDEVDMLTVVLVGSTETRVFETGDGGWRMFTPRGYAVKSEGGGQQ